MTARPHAARVHTRFTASSRWRLAVLIPLGRMSASSCHLAGKPVTREPFLALGEHRRAPATAEPAN
jgi:hypothetical protein